MSASEINSPDSVASSTKLSEACRQARLWLLFEMLGELSESDSFTLFQHVRHCRSCLESLIALQAAAELACPLGDDAW